MTIGLNYWIWVNYIGTNARHFILKASKLLQGGLWHLMTLPLIFHWKKIE